MGLTHRWTIVFFAAAFLLSACPRPSPPPDRPAVGSVQGQTTSGAADQEGLPTQERHASGATNLEGPCTPQNCGSNSAFVNGSVVGAIPLGGQPNGNGFSIEPALHPRNGTKDPTLRLDVRDGQIVGVDAKDYVVAMGDELKGRWFRLFRRGADRAPEERGKVRIVDVAFVRLMADRRHHSLDPDKLKPEALNEDEVAVGYELEYEPEVKSGVAKPTNLCRYKAPLFLPNMVAQMSATLGRLENTANSSGRRSWVSSKVDWIRKLPRSVFEAVAGELPLHKPASLIFAIKGEAYNEITATIDQEPGSFNLACPSTALSKMKLMGYDPQDRAFSTTLVQRQAVLKMLTGRYCGDFVFTEDGQPLYWDNQSRWFSWSPEGAVEALWNETGAICLNQPRNAIHTREEVSRYCRNLPLCSESVSRRSFPEGAELITINPR
jgi:ADYC domain